MGKIVFCILMKPILIIFFFECSFYDKNLKETILENYQILYKSLFYFLIWKIK